MPDVFVSLCRALLRSLRGGGGAEESTWLPALHALEETMSIKGSQMCTDSPDSSLMANAFEMFMAVKTPCGRMFLLYVSILVAWTAGPPPHNIGSSLHIGKCGRSSRALRPASKRPRMPFLAGMILPLGKELKA